jgi:hypothetical protein
MNLDEYTHFLVNSDTLHGSIDPSHCKYNKLICMMCIRIFIDAMTG